MAVNNTTDGPEMAVIPRSWGGWLAVAKNRPLASSGSSPEEARSSLVAAIRQFDRWAALWERDHAVVDSVAAG